MPQPSYPEWIAPDPWVPERPRDWVPEPEPAPPPEESKWKLPAILFPVGAVLGFLGVLLLGAVFGRHHSQSRRPPAALVVPTTAPPATTPPTTRPADPAASALSGLVVNQADVPPDVSVQLIPGGNQVIGEATLDLCNGTFPSEAKRTARLQVTAVDAGGEATLSTEAVLYQNEAATAQGFAELRDVAAHCTQDTMRPSPDGSWPSTPTVERLAYDFIPTAGNGPADHSVAVYLRRGRVLMGVYFPRPDGPQSPVEGKTSIPDIVTVFAGRIAALPASVVNG